MTQTKAEPNGAGVTKRVFSASSIQQFLTCRQKYFIYRILRLVPPSRRMPLEFGYACEKAVTCLHAEGWDQKRAAEVFDQHFTDDPMYTKRTRQTGHTMIKRYAQAYENQPFKIISQGFPFRLHIKELPGVQLIGEIDRVVDWHGRIMIDETKTTSQLTADYMKRFWVDYQTIIYLIAAKQIIDPKISAILADAALVAKSDPKKLRSEPLLRDIVERTDDQLAYSRLRLIQIVKEMVICHEAYESGENDLWYENDQSCNQYGVCEYLRHCKEAPSVRESVLAQDFVLREDNSEAYEKYDNCREADFVI